MNSRLLIKYTAALAVIVFGTLAFDTWNRVKSDDEPASPAPRSGRELVFIFIGSSVCAPSKAPGFDETIKKAANGLSRTAESRGMRFVRVGVALTATPEGGSRFLRDFGDFDEMLAGRGWMNQGAISFFWRDIVGTESVPQVLILARQVTVSPRGVHVSADSVLIRVVGVDGIRQWVNAGTPL